MPEINYLDLMVVVDSEALRLNILENVLLIMYRTDTVKHLKRYVSERLFLLVGIHIFFQRHINVLGKLADIISRFEETKVPWNTWDAHL